MEAARHLHPVPSPPPPFEGFDGEPTPENMRRLIAELGSERDANAGLQVTIKSQAGLIGRLERALEEADPTQHPQHAEMAKLIDRWKAATGHKNAKKSKDRYEVIKARLRDGYSFDVLALAIDGLGAFPFVHQGARVRQGQPTERHDRLGIALGGGEDVERFANLGHRARQQGLCPWALGES